MRLRRAVLLLLLLAGCRSIVDLSPGDAGEQDDAAPPGDGQVPDAPRGDAGFAPDATPPDAGDVFDAAS
jgi:hypothetical protein